LEFFTDAGRREELRMASTAAKPWQNGCATSFLVFLARSWRKESAAGVS
jgi:hypothetical protein